MDVRLFCQLVDIAATGRQLARLLPSTSQLSQVGDAPELLKQLPLLLDPQLLGHAVGDVGRLVGRHPFGQCVAVGHDEPRIPQPLPQHLRLGGQQLSHVFVGGARRLHRPLMSSFLIFSQKQSLPVCKKLLATHLSRAIWGYSK